MAYNPPIGSIYHLYTTDILPSGGLYATYDLLREPETTIECQVGFANFREESGAYHRHWIQTGVRLGS